jgi:hypothetical protein
MSAKKDMRRADLGKHDGIGSLEVSANHLQVIPYVEPKDDQKSDFSSTITSTMPMAAVSPDMCEQKGILMSF